MVKKVNNLAVEPYIVSGIEWDLDRKFHYGIENAKYIESLINNIKTLPIKNGSINFSDNKWDFRPYYKMKKSYNLVFTFHTVPECYLTTSKYFVLLSLLNSENKLSTLFRRYSDIKSFLIYLDKNGIKSIERIKEKHINDYLITKTHCSANTKAAILIALQTFFEFLLTNYSYNLLLDMSVFNQISFFRSLATKTVEQNKTPNIPSEYYNQLLSILIKSMRDNKLNYKYRSTACITLILSQTGLRITEILSLEIDSLKSLHLKNINQTGYFLKTKIFKSASKHSEYIISEIFANELTKEAFEVLIDIRTMQTKHKETTLLYIPNTETLPATEIYFRNQFLDFLYKYAKFSCGDVSPYPELKVIKNDGKPVFAPTTKQFRVRVCTELYTNNVPLLYIQKYMTHLSDDMMGYYVRPKTQKQEDIEYSNKLLKNLISNQTTLLGNDSSQIHKKIEEFIAEKKLNVKEDLDTIIEELNGQFVIRAKRGGVCIKTGIRECAKDARTNEMFCAYNVCPNLFHLYYMADISYEDFLSTIKTFEYNHKNGFKLQASKELNKIKSLCKKRLLPELEDLHDKMNSYGINKILIDYPNLSFIIENYDTIMEEINKWMKKRY